MSQDLGDARQRIETVKRERGDALDLSGLRLRSVPDGVADLTWLRELKLDENWLPELPESLANLTRLTHLELDDNRLAEVPEWIAGLRDLTWLDLGDNHIIEVPDWLGDLTCLTHLDLNGCDLDAAPEWIADLTSLTELQLANNFLTEVPEWIGQLAGLTKLQLYRNRLRTLPESLARLTELTRLEIDGNRLIEIPRWIGQLDSLTWLDLGGNQFPVLPDWLGNLTALTRIDLSDSHLTAVPGWLVNLTELAELYLEDNWLTEVPGRLGDLTELTTLRLDGNRLRTLPGSLARLTKLTRLDIDSNRLTEIPAWIGQLADLTSLDLGENRFSELPDTLGDLTSLQRLDLTDCKLATLPGWLGRLTQLTELDLSGNQLIEVPRHLAGLDRLSALYLLDNKLTALPDWFGSLTRITALYLNNNDFSELPDVVRSLTRLSTLGLLDNKLTKLPDWLGSLTRLSYLFVRGNQLSELPAALRGLTGLAGLDLSHNQFADLPDWLGDLTDLTQLYLADNPIAGLPDWIGQLTSLEWLYVAKCQIAEMPSWLGRLTNLTFLDLSENNLSGLTDSISSLIGLQMLELSDNKLTAVPDEVGKLTGLMRLSLDGNKLGQVPESLADLTGLRTLDLRKTGLDRLPDWIGNLTGITWLRISANELAELPESLRNLAGLSYLGLSGNKVSALPDWIDSFRGLVRIDSDGNRLTSVPPSLARLRALNHLYLADNRLTEVPDCLLDLPELEDLSLADNPTLISPPPEIAASGTESVLAFLRARREGATRQWVSKLLVVGEGGVGKTSLIKALTGAEHDPAEETTHGIRVKDLLLRHPDRDDVAMRLSTWDFGGQQIYHATHQFFLTDRSLFLLLWNARLGWEQGRLQYWLDIIKSRAPQSPVLLVATHADASQRPVDLPLDDLLREYPQIAGSLVMDNQTRRGLDGVRDELARRAADLPLMGTEWPTTWLNAAEAVKACPENHITPERMWQLMSAAGVTESDQQQYIAVAMHQLGDILYYHDDPELVQTVVLSPEWVNGYISEVLDSPEVDRARGLLTQAEMTRLWASLDRGMRDHFLGMMDKYEISFRVDDEPAGVVSLVVERLPWNPPPYEDVWNETRGAPGMSEIRVIYQLNTTPPGIPTWFIARSHRFTTNIHWRTGAVLRHPDGKHTALVRANPRRNTVELTVRGPAPAAYFSVLDDGFNRTLERYPGLEIKRLVPCPCAADGRCTELFEYDDLQKRLLREPPRHEIECRKSGEFLNVPQLLLGLAPSERDATRVGVERLTTLFDGIVDKMADQDEYMQRMFLKLLRVVQDQQEVRCPSVFSVAPVKYRTTGTRLRLRLYCEEPGAWHPLPGDAGRYEINEPADWLQKVKPHLSQLLTVLKHAAPLAGPVLGMTVAHISERMKAEIETMTELVSQIPEPSRVPHSLAKDEVRRNPGPAARAGDDADFRTLEALLLKLDPGKEWGGLSRTVTPEGLTLYLCREHGEAYRRAVRL